MRARQNPPADVEALLAAGAALEAETKDGWRALHFAAARNHLLVLAKLIAASADLEAATKDGNSALQLAGAAEVILAGGAADIICNVVVEGSHLA
jgi:ankyrin repeat protein